MQQGSARTAQCHALALNQGRRDCRGGAFRKAFKPQRRASDRGAASPLSSVGDKTLNDIAAFHLNGNRSGETQSVLASEEILINTHKE